MSGRAVGSRSATWLIVIGAAVFMCALAVSAIFDPGVRGLHVVQASIYVATIVLSRRGNRWGYFLGFSAAAFWNYVLLFVSPSPSRFMQHPTEPDLLVQGVAWIANALIIVGAVAAFLQLPKRSLADVGRLVVAFAAATGILAGGTAIFSPDRLAIFTQALHPHWMR